MQNRKGAYLRGLAAEQACAAHLKAKGYRILGLRVRTVGGEIDIVAIEGDTLVIIEVKARKNTDDSLYAVTKHKQRRLVRATEALLADPAKIIGLGMALPPNIRFDVMAATPGAPPLHLENAWGMEDEY